MVIRLRPWNAEELVADSDFVDCVELQPELLSILFVELALAKFTNVNHNV